MKLIRPRASHPDGAPGKWHIVDREHGGKVIRASCGWKPMYRGEVVDLDEGNIDTGGHIHTLYRTRDIESYCKRCGIGYDRFMNVGRPYDSAPIREKVIAIIRADVVKDKTQTDAKKAGKA